MERRMKLGVISDIHNNPVALEAVLSEFDRRGVEMIICLGDVIGIGPMPQEAADMVRGIPNLVACLRGNHEDYLLEGDYDAMDDEERALHRWEHGILSAEAKAFLAATRREIKLEMEGVTIWAAHYPMENGGFLRARRDTAAGACPPARVCLFGHDHPRFMRCEAGRLLLDFGSLGCPGKARNVARGGILHLRDGRCGAETVDVTYDVDRVLRAMDQRGMPARDTVRRIFYGV